MMTKRIIWQAPDGNIKVSVPVEQPLPGEPMGMYLDRIALTAMSTDPGLIGHTRLENVDSEDLPARRFRNCWRWTLQAGVDVDLPLAREQLLAEVRVERTVRLTASDVDKNRLDDVGTPQQRQDLGSYRQALRDLPAVVQMQLALLGTAEALEAYQAPWPLKPA